ncbi:PDF receptor [Planococcus citri]|uniref:PDF receptor n=1 Tax=Planococcus citri TaxID=170843 RepID=UPI0031FA2BEC
MDGCNQSYSTFMPSEIFCNWTQDALLCWPATKANTTVEQPCPKMKGSDTTKIVRKYCGENGEWDSRANITNWTNYTGCFTKEILLLLERIQNMSPNEFERRIDVAKIVRILEVVGLTASSIILVLSISIYYLFGNLKNDRTLIHKNLFMAALGAVLMKLLICIDQILTGYGNILPTNSGVDGTPFLCEVSYILLEYCKSSTYMWMFIEASHLYNAVAVTATPLSFKKSYLLLGWFLSAVFVVVWVTIMISKPQSHCWYAYNYNPLYWILEGPRIFALVVNTIYLINIVKVVVVKVRNNHTQTNEVEKIKKTLKATLVLLPLLGITNYLSHIEPQLDCPLWYFELYTFMSYFLNSFQGMLIGLLYCLLNQEVKETVLNRIRVRYSSASSELPQVSVNIRKNDCNEQVVETIENLILKF